ncbi:MAG: MoaD/ThiS family protein [Beutenbergiaceae bacterium]
MTTVRYFAAAAQAAGTEREEIPATTIGELRSAMVQRHGGELAQVLARCALLLNGQRTEDDSQPTLEVDQVDVLPPFAGG